LVDFRAPPGFHAFLNFLLFDRRPSLIIFPHLSLARGLLVFYSRVRNLHLLENSPHDKMPSASKEKRLAKKAAEGKEKKTLASKTKAGSKTGSTSASAAGSVNGDETPPIQLDANGKPIESDEPATSADKMDEVKRLAEQMDQHGLSDRVTTGVLASVDTAKDVKIISSSLVFHGRVLLTDSTLELSYGRRYGLLGENGCGKSTLMKSIAAREFPIPEHVDIYLLNEGAPKTDLGALEWVVKEAENEMDRLDRLAEKLLEDEGPESLVLMDLYDVSLSSR
jgi:ATP-binding cassette, subfamily F, member 2